MAIASLLLSNMCGHFCSELLYSTNASNKFEAGSLMIFIVIDSSARLINGSHL